MNEILIIQKQEFDNLLQKLDYLTELVSTTTKKSDKKIITNDQLIADYGISKKTAQNWRTDGLIRYMQVGRKIYYNIDDVHETLNNHSYESFKNKSKKKR
jgi:phage pi2 protein 07